MSEAGARARMELYARVLRHLPKRLRRIAYYRLLQLHTYRGTSRVRSVTRWGDTMFLKPGDFVDDHLLCDGVWEPHVIDRIDAVLDGTGWFFDVGAHIGTCTLAAAHRLGDRGRVVAFEPTPGNFSRLAANLEVNARRNVTVINAAVGALPGLVQLETDEAGNSGRSRIIASGGQSAAMTTLDAAWASLGKPRVQLIKIDVEGFELGVLQGGTELLATHPSLLLELTPGDRDDERARAVEVLRVLASAGYRVERWVENTGWIAGEVPLASQWDLWATV